MEFYYCSENTEFETFVETRCLFGAQSQLSDQFKGGECVESHAGKNGNSSRHGPFNFVFKIFS